MQRYVPIVASYGFTPIESGVALVAVGGGTCGQGTTGKGLTRERGMERDL